MRLSELLARLPATDLDDLALPRAMLGAFRRKSITFCTGVTDETTVVYWFQSRSFTIDLRLPDAAATPVPDRQGWIGDTLWDAGAQEMSWRVESSYQPRNQWPEPARFTFIGNSVLEFAPSGAYVEDWRQQSGKGPLLGLRLLPMRDDESREDRSMDGGLILAGEHLAYALSRPAAAEKGLRNATDLGRALADGLATEMDIASYEVSIATNGSAVTHSTRPERLGQAIVGGDFAVEDDGSITLRTSDTAPASHLRFAVDLYAPDFAFTSQTPCTAEACEWMRRESDHLARHAKIVL